MRLQNLGFLGFGYAPWGIGIPGATSPAPSSTEAGAGAVSSAGTPGASGNAGTDSTSGGTGSSNDASTLAGAISQSSIGNALSSALSNSLTGSAAELAVVRESETLKIQLTDGSQVTIRVRAQGAAFSAAQTQADGSSSATAAIFASGRLQVSVDGNLSSADMQAISDVVTQVNALATQFFSGDVQDAFAAAASLNIDPSEIAGFSMKLSYSSTLFQQASAAGAAPGAGSTTSSAPTGSQSSPGGATEANSTAAAANSAPITPTSDSSTAAPSLSDSSTATPSPSDAATSPAGAGSPDSSPASTAQPAANPASPQQIIINFIQTVMAKLGRGSVDSPSHLRISSRWKLHLLAQALPAYAQAQGAGATAPSTPAIAAQGATSVAAPTPRLASNRYPTLQAARLAADTLSQLAQ